jgi:hypothetical protein
MPDFILTDLVYANALDLFVQRVTELLDSEGILLFNNNNFLIN